MAAEGAGGADGAGRGGNTGQSSNNDTGKTGVSAASKESFSSQVEAAFSGLTNAVGVGNKGGFGAVADVLGKGLGPDVLGKALSTTGFDPGKLGQISGLPGSPSLTGLATLAAALDNRHGVLSSVLAGLEDAGINVPSLPGLGPFEPSTSGDSLRKILPELT